jgi:hypothetical protein
MRRTSTSIGPTGHPAGRRREPYRRSLQQLMCGFYVVDRIGGLIHEYIQVA